MKLKTLTTGEEVYGFYNEKVYGLYLPERRNEKPRYRILFENDYDREVIVFKPLVWVGWDWVIDNYGRFFFLYP